MVAPLLAKLGEIRQHRHFKQCQRCHLRYDARQGECPHCAGLNEQQVQQLREARESARAGNRSLGWAFLFIAAALLILLLLYVIL